MIDEIAKLLTRAETETPSSELLDALKLASVDVTNGIAKESKKKDQFWTAATDIRTDTKTRAAAKDGHADLEFLIATLESASDQLTKAYKSVEAGIGAVARDESRKVIDAQRKAVIDRIKSEWDAHVDVLDNMLAELAEAERVTKDHNIRHRDQMPTAESLLGRPVSVGTVYTTPMSTIHVQRIDATKPLRRGRHA